MLKISLGKKNRLTNLLFAINKVVEEGDMKYFRFDTLEAILSKSFNLKSLKYGKDYTVELLDNIVSSQFIIVENEDVKKYIAFSFEQPCATRNGFVMTKLDIPFRLYIMDETEKEKALEVCLLDVDTEVYNKKKGVKDAFYTLEELNIDSLKSNGVINPYNIFTYKLLKTLNIRILNESSLPFEYYMNTANGNKNILNKYINASVNVKQGFFDVESLRKYRLESSSRNTGNKSSFILESDKYIVCYGKTFGNNGHEVVMIACAISELAKSEGKDVVFYQIKDNLGVDGTENKRPAPISSKNLDLLRKFGITVYDELQEYQRNPEQKDLDDKDSRNQAEFMKNLMIKYGKKGNEDEKRCYLCGANIQKMIVASHIHRVADINKLAIPFEEKRKMAVDGNNGFWLCSNHDKLFEFGIISFDEETGKFVLGQDFLNSESLTEEQKIYINASLNTDCIEKEHFTKELQNYLKIHNDRIRKENKRLNANK